MIIFRFFKWLYLNLCTSKYTKVCRKSIHLKDGYKRNSWYKYSIKHGKIEGKIIKVIDEYRVVFEPYNKKYRSLNSTYITDLYVDY